MGEVIAFEEFVRMRRQRVARECHARCCTIVHDSVAMARAELRCAPASEWSIRTARLRKLQELEAYTSALG